VGADPSRQALDDESRAGRARSRSTRSLSVPVAPKARMARGSVPSSPASRTLPEGRDIHLRRQDSDTRLWFRETRPSSRHPSVVPARSALAALELFRVLEPAPLRVRSRRGLRAQRGPCVSPWLEDMSWGPRTLFARSRMAGRSFRAPDIFLRARPRVFAGSCERRGRACVRSTSALRNNPAEHPQGRRLPRAQISQRKTGHSEAGGCSRFTARAPTSAISRLKRGSVVFRRA